MYNVATEFEYLQNYKDACKTCLSGIEFCKDILGSSHSLYLKFNKLYTTVSKYEENKEKDEKTANLMNLGTAKFYVKKILPRKNISLDNKMGKNLHENNKSLMKCLMLPFIKTPGNIDYHYKINKLKESTIGQMNQTNINFATKKGRSEERRVGKESTSWCRSGGAPEQ